MEVVDTLDVGIAEDATLEISDAGEDPEMPAADAIVATQDAAHCFARSAKTSVACVINIVGSPAPESRLCSGKPVPRKAKILTHLSAEESLDTVCFPIICREYSKQEAIIRKLFYIS